MKIQTFPYTFLLNHAFNLAIHSRTTTPAVFLKIEIDGITAWGEASLPPYLGETQKSVIEFIESFPWKTISPETSVQEFHLYMDQHKSGNNAAKACMDIAWHDFQAKQNKQSCMDFLNILISPTIPSSFTIGIHPPDLVQIIASQNKDFLRFKLKLGGNQDREMIRAIRKISQLPICVDVNQGWSNLDQAQTELEWLATQNVILAEQPFPKEWLEESSKLKSISPIPIFGDESVQRLSDLEFAANAFHGINVKLMKATGILEAKLMIELAKSLNLKVLLGSMTESSLATQAANCLSPLVDFVDLDGPWLINNNPCPIPSIDHGIIQPFKGWGFGVEPILNKES